MMAMMTPADYKQFRRLAPPTSVEHHKMIGNMFTSMQDLLTNLAFRWLDESQYEDIKDYKKVIQQKLPEGFTITKMNKRPFGFNFTIGTDAEYQIKVTTRAYEWKRIK